MTSTETAQTLKTKWNLFLSVDEWLADGRGRSGRLRSFISNTQIHSSFLFEIVFFSSCACLKHACITLQCTSSGPRRYACQVWSRWDKQLAFCVMKRTDFFPPNITVDTHTEKGCKHLLLSLVGGEGVGGVGIIAFVYLYWLPWYCVLF